MTNVLLVQPSPARALPARAALTLTEPDAFEITQVHTVAQAVKELEQRVFDVALIDLACPDAGGTRAVINIRRLAPKLPIVVLVDRGQESLAARAMTVGARDYVVKVPAQGLLLSRVIRHAIEGERAEEVRTRVLEALRVSTARYRSLFENAVMGMAFATLSGQLTDVNAALCETLGRTEDELFAVTLQSLVHPDDAHRDWAFLDELRDGRLGSFEIERRFLHSEGRAIWGLANFSVVRDNRGQPLQLVFKLRDITERKRAEQDLRISQEESRLILETANDAFIAADGDGVIRNWTSRAELMFGWTREEAIGRSLADTIIPEPLRAEHQRALERRLDLGRRGSLNRQFETHALHREGHEFPVEITLWSTENDGVVRFNAFVRDISERVRTEAALRESEIRFRAIFEGSSIGIAIGNSRGEVIASNPALQGMLGYSAEEMLGKAYHDVVHPEDADIKDDERHDLMAGRRETYVAERRYLRKDGSSIWLSVTASLVRDESGAPEFLVNVIEDMTERKQAEAAVRESAMQLVDLVSAAATEASTVEEVLQIGIHHVCSRLGWPVGHVYLASGEDPPALVPTELWHFADPDRYEAFRETTMALRLDPGEELAGRVLMTGKAIWVTDMTRDPLLIRAEAARRVGLRGAFASPLLVGNEVLGVLEFFSTEAVTPDPALQEAIGEIGHQLGRVTERKRIDAMYAHRALHDALTDLPNRILFVDRLGHALSRIDRMGGRLALLFVDLDGFKDVNDSFGHDVGDSVLMAFAERVRDLLRPSDTVARFGGDEFTILCEDLRDDHEAVGIAQRILELLKEPMLFDDLKLAITPSIGIAMAKGSYERPETLLRNADVAMYRAKERGGGCYQIFDESLRKHVLNRGGMEWRLRRAIEANQLRVYYQPSFGLRDGSVMGVEALVRWEHPERGLIGPSEFVPLAEETGLVIPMGQWVLTEACRQQARWRKMFPDRELPQLWVNLSSRQLSYADLPQHLSAVMAEFEIDPSEICLEITETVLLDDEEAIEELQKLRALGVSLSIDDFGTGYSSLTCLKRLPVAQIKLDRSFVAGLGTHASDSAIVAGVIDMAHALGLTVAAEGVETEAQLTQLRRLGCDCAQGFYFATPQPAEAITELIDGRALEPAA